MAGGSRRIVVGFILEGDEKFKQSLDGIRQGAIDFGEDGARAAQDLVDGFTAIENGAVRVAQKIEQGKTVSERDLKAMQQAYAALSSEIESTFGSLENAPDEIRTAFADAEQRIGAATSVVRDLASEADKAKQKFNDLADAYEGVADAGTATTNRLTPEQQKVADGIERWKRVVNEFEDKLAETADVSKGDVEKIWKAQALLNDELRRTGVTVDQLGPEFVAEMQKMEAATRDATVTMSNLETVVKSNEAAIQGAGAGFTSFGDALAQLDGPIGNATRQLGLFGSALGAGIIAGNQFNKAIGTDMSEVDKIMEGWALKSKSMIENWADSLIEQALLVKGIYTLDLEEIKESGENFADAIKRLWQDAAKSGEEFRREREQQQRQAEEQRRQEQGLQEATNGTTEAINERIAKIKEMLPQADLNTLKIKEQAQELAKLVNNTDNLNDVERENFEAIIKKSSAVQKSTEDIKELEERINKVGQIQKQWTDGINKFELSTGNAARQVGELADGIQKFQLSSGDAADKSENAAKHIKGLGDEAKPTATTVIELADGVARLNTEIDGLLDRGPKAADVMRRLQSASAAAAGSETGGTIPTAQNGGL